MRDPHQKRDAQQRLLQYKGVLKRWVQNYPFEPFNVIDFHSRSRPWQLRLVKASSENRHAACQLIDGLNRLVLSARSKRRYRRRLRAYETMYLAGELSQAYLRWRVEAWTAFLRAGGCAVANAGVL